MSSLLMLLPKQRPQLLGYRFMECDPVQSAQGAWDRSGDTGGISETDAGFPGDKQGEGLDDQGLHLAIISTIFFHAGRSKLSPE